MRDGGQSVVELALVLPVLMVLCLVVLQVGLVVHQHLMVTHAAREAARTAAVDERPGAARQAALDGSDLDENRLAVEVTGRGDAGSRVRVEVRYRAPTDVPLVGPLVGDVGLRAAVTMRVE